MTFDEWHRQYATQSYPPIVDIEAAWNAAVEACAQVAEAFPEYSDFRNGFADLVDRTDVAASLRALSTDKADSAKAT